MFCVCCFVLSFGLGGGIDGLDSFVFGFFGDGERGRRVRVWGKVGGFFYIFWIR